MKLSDIVKIPGAADRRAELRKAATPLFDSYGSARIKLAFNGSPIVGSSKTQVDVRPTPSGLRDSLSEAVLLALVVGEIDIDDVLAAIMQPHVYGREFKGSKTGFLFGHPSKLTDGRMETIRASALGGMLGVAISVGTTPTITTKTIKSGETMTNLVETVKTCDLGHLMNSFDKLVERVPGMATTNHYKTALLEAVNTDANAMSRIEHAVVAIDAAGASRTVKTDPHIPALVDKAVEILKAKGYAVLGPDKDADPAKTILFRAVDPAQSAVIDAVLAAIKLPPINDLLGQIAKATEDNVTLARELGELKAKPAATVTLMAPGTTIKASGGGGIPNGEVKTKPAHQVFGLPKGTSFDFDVPVWEWDAPHPYVPELDKDYIFRPKELMAALYALITGERSWSSGHTGTGKTTLWEQIGARLGWPVRVLSFDSEITRADLIGQHVLVNDGGTTISKFVEGILPQCMNQPILLVCDEVDFIRPDVAYVMQRVLEMKGLTLTEDGGRIVTPHPMFRIVATANTEGQGDDYGMYAGARVQSAAFLDRFTNWIRVDYLSDAQRLALLKAKVPTLDDPTAAQVNKYTTEHIEAFKAAKVMKPISPRGMISLGTKISNYLSIFPSKSRKEAVQQALDSCILNACTQQDRVVLQGIAARVFV